MGLRLPKCRTECRPVVVGGVVAEPVEPAEPGEREQLEQPERVEQPGQVLELELVEEGPKERMLPGA